MYGNLKSRIYNNQKDSLRKLLIVDDDPDILKYFCKIAEEIKFKVFTAENGRKALKTAENEFPGVVLLDYMLPDNNGAAVLSRLKNIYPFVQVIAVSGFGKDEAALKMIQSGASCYIKKPVNKGTMVGLLKKCHSEYRELCENVGLTRVDVAGVSRNLVELMLKKIPTDVSLVNHSERYSDAFKNAFNYRCDIVIIDYDKNGFDLLREIRSQNVITGVVLLTKEANEETALNALKNGADCILGKTDDLHSLPEIIEKIRLKINLKRLKKFRDEKLNRKRSITASVTEERKIRLSLSDTTKGRTSSFALRLLDNIPVGIALVEKNHNILYMNRFLRKMMPAPTDKIGLEILEAVKNSGTCDVSLKVIKDEIEKLFNRKEDIETIVLGGDENLTLTSMIVKCKGTSKETVLLILR